MTVTAPPRRDTATVPPPVLERPPVERVPTRPPRFMRWLPWLAALLIAGVALTVGIIMTREDAEPPWTQAELEAIASTYAGDLVLITPSPIPPEMQVRLDEMATSYASDLDAQPLTPDDAFWGSVVGSTYQGDLDTGIDGDRAALLERLADVAASYEGDIAPTD